MTEQEIWRRFTALPADAQQQVAELISSLHTHLGAEVEAKSEQAEAETQAFFGIWQDRKDLGESGMWVRELREKEWPTHR